MVFLPLYALFRRECKRFLRVPGQSILTPIVTSSLYLLIFGVSLAKSLQFFSLNYLEFLLPGLIMMGTINNAYLNSCSSLIISKYYGDIEDLKIAPLSTFVILQGMALASSVRAFLVALSIFLVGNIFCKAQLDTWLVPNHPLLALYIVWVAGYSFGLLSTAVGATAKTFETLNSISQFILLPLIYLGGIFYPTNYLPSFWQKIAYCNPMFYYIDSFRYAFFSVSEIQPSFSVAFVTIFFGLFYVCSYICISKASFKRT
ncbi:MAG: ABC transporter permease [Chlamydiota bacterium]